MLKPSYKYAYNVQICLHENLCIQNLQKHLAQNHRTHLALIDYKKDNASNLKIIMLGKI